MSDARAQRWADQETLRSGVEASANALLDALESSLSAVGSGPFAGGAQSYTLADAVLTVFLTLVSGSMAHALDTHTRRQSSLYFVRMRERPSYSVADVWSGPRPGKMLSVLGNALVAPFAALGTAVRAAAQPLQETEAFKSAAAAYADMHNSVTVPLQEEVKPAVESFIITPAYEALTSVRTNVLDPVGHAAAEGLGAAGEAMQHVADTAPVKAVAQSLAPVVDMGKKVQDRYVTPLATTVMDSAVVRVA